MPSRWLRAIAVLAAFVVLVTSCSVDPEIVPLATSAAPISSGSAAPAALPPAPPMSRASAIDLLISEAFLPADTAGCVVDTIFQDVGVYNPNNAEAQAAMSQGGVVARCTEDATDIGEADDDVYVPEIDGPAEWVEPDLSRLAPFELTEASMPALNPGGRATGTVEIGGKTIEYVTVTPAGFTIGDTAPVFLAFPPGGQSLDLAESVVDVVYQDQAVSRGWVVVSPASPDGTWHDGNTASAIPELMSWMQAWVTPENGKPHIGGMSNGGLSAFHIAVQIPSHFQSLLVFPGYARNGADRDGVSRLTDLPVRMWVGGDDTSWVSAMESTKASIERVDGDVELWVLEGEPHILESTQNGIAFFDQLDNARIG